MKVWAFCLQMSWIFFGLGGGDDSSDSYLRKVQQHSTKTLVFSNISEFLYVSFGTGCRHGMLSIERFLWFQLCSLEPRMACGSLERTPTKPLKLFNSGESFVYKCLYKKICSFIMIYI